MLYDNDISYLLSLWEERVSFNTSTQEYKDAVRDCMYDLKVLNDKNRQYLKAAQEMLGSGLGANALNSPALSAIINQEAAAYLSSC